MRVLDGGIAIFSAVEGVQPQTESVWRQADRYQVPRVCFINKMDRVGADHKSVLAAMEKRLKVRALPLQLPVGQEAAFAGVIDLINEEVITFSGEDQGMTVERKPVSADYQVEVLAARNAIVEAAADFDDVILEDFLKGEPSCCGQAYRCPAKRGNGLQFVSRLSWCSLAQQRYSASTGCGGAVSSFTSGCQAGQRSSSGRGDVVSTPCDPEASR